MTEVVDLTLDDDKDTKALTNCTEGSSSKNNPKEPKDSALWCEYCQVQLADAPSMQKHIVENRHGRLYKEACSEIQEMQKRGIFVRGYSEKDGLLDYLSQYGRIIWAKFGHDYLLFDYVDASSASAAIRKRHFFKNKPLVVKYRVNQHQKPSTEELQVRGSNDIAADETELLELLKTPATLQQQTYILRNYQSGMILQQLQNFRRICVELYSVLSPVYPNCQIHPFGSTVTGLSFRNSDLDVHIAGVRYEHDNEVWLLHRLKRILMESGLFRYVLVIGNAKIPIMKCIHAATDTRLDINIRNMLGICNSELIKYYMSLNPHVADAMFILKYWAKSHKLTGQNHLFTNYTLAMLMIFFLQQRPYHFPAVYDLQQNSQFRNIQDGWNGGFELLPVSRKMMNMWDVGLSKILGDFFRFYAEFDYANLVVCPYLGYALKKERFTKLDELPPAFSAYRHYLKEEGRPFKYQASMCVQDPFEHSRNITPIVSDATIKFFVSFCELGDTIISDINEAGVLYSLFTMQPISYAEALSQQNNLTKQVEIEMGNDCKYLLNKINDSVLDKQKAMNREWFKTFTEFLQAVLKNVLLMSCEELTLESPTKTRRSDGQNSVHNVTAVCYRCTSNLNVWGNRPLRPSKNKLIDEETKITERICKGISASRQPILEVQFRVELKEEPPTKVIIELNKISAYKKTFKGFSSFVIERLTKWFNTYERELNEATLCVRTECKKM